MTNAWFIYNGNIDSSFFQGTYEIYENSAIAKKINLQKIKNNELYTVIENGEMKIKSNQKLIEPHFILLMDKDVKLAYQLEKLGYKVFNSSKCISNCDDKEITFQRLSNSGIKMPKTIYSPLIFKGTKEKKEDFIKFVEKELSYPIVVKESRGSFGWQVYLVKNKKELMEKRKELLYTPHLYQEFIKTSIGHDVRLNVVGGKVVASILRVSKNDFRANVINGSETFMYTPSEKFIEVAIKASEILEATFCGVDILFGEKNEPVLCEVNSNAGIKETLSSTNINVADYIFDYILNSLQQ